MLIFRFISGFWLVALAVGVIVGDAYLAPWYPVLFVAATLFAGLGTRELVALFPEPGRPPLWLALGGVILVIAANWVVPLHQYFSEPAGGTVDRVFYVPQPRTAYWGPVLFVFVAVVLIAFLFELVRFRTPGPATARLSATAFAVFYLGLLPSFLVQLRWLGSDAGLAIALAIFVPKVGDIGAYTAGRLFGRHRMTPALSPKKTWEGFAGGLAASVATALLPTLWHPSYSAGFAVGFGLTVGLAGVVGDLAESLLKRDAGAKDAARSIPGYGGVLDVIDAVLFAAPVAYFWFVI